MEALQSFINEIAYIGDSNDEGIDSQYYYSKCDDSYLTHVGMEDKLKYLFDLGITEQIQNGTDHKVANIGFNPKENKWYGWSHRAIYGFTIGSEVKQGDCAYVPVDIDDARKDAVRFWTDEHCDITGATYERDEDDRAYFQVDWDYKDSVPNKKLHGTSGGVRHYLPEEFGRGEWLAETLEDAKQMAIEFASSVS